MNIRILFFLILLGTGALLLAACGGTSQPATDEQHGHVEPPAEYADLTNPFDDDHEAIEAGEVIYQANCAACHGSEGAGDGPVAEGLDPKPSNFTDTHMMEELSDGYLFWRASEGGAFEPFNSGMPAWKGILSEEERWQVTSFIRSLGEEH